MAHLTRADLYTLEAYAEARSDFRARVIAHKKLRRVALGPNATLYFEDRLTVQYQIQEMLRIERIFEARAIEEELGAYNPLIPDGRNWKATFMLEFPDANERRIALEQLLGIEDAVWAQVAGHARVMAIADEDLERRTDTKTSAVHFVRLQIDDAMAAALKDGAELSMGVDLDAYRHCVAPLPAPVQACLTADIG
ncbi:MAG: DUF3501 family protein [Chromatiales bacterium]|jgi:hypothetical protein|nr:DUF3501 family protein [Chromatiales bacterium]